MLQYIKTFKIMLLRRNLLEAELFVAGQIYMSHCLQFKSIRVRCGIGHVRLAQSQNFQQSMCTWGERWGTGSKFPPHIFYWNRTLGRKVVVFPLASLENDTPKKHMHAVDGAKMPQPASKCGRWQSIVVLI